MASLENEILQLLNTANPTKEEKKLLLQYLNDADGSVLLAVMQDLYAEDETDFYQINTEKSREILKNINREIARSHKIKRGIVSAINIRLLRIAAAACFIGILFLGVYIWIRGNNQNISKKETAKVYNKDVMPGGDKAVLTLSDGSVVILDKAQNGTLTRQGNSKVIKYDGKLVYSAAPGFNSKEVLYNIISTPRGGKYQLQLPDGSLVWLNAASSIRFPTVFSGKDRRVEITGEAYFEVTKNKAKPFIVEVNDAQVQVLGTHFDIMAYADEASIKTTLLEGSVKFENNGVTNILRPGQQAQLYKDDKVKVVDNVDLEDVMAWKNGIFRFQGEDISEVLRQLTRWYDVEVVCDKSIDDLFYAEIPRDTKLSDVLKALELTGKVHFRFDGRRIIVMP